MENNASCENPMEGNRMQDQQPDPPSSYFYGEVSRPASHPRMTKGFVEFYVSIRSVGDNGLEIHKPVELIDQEGKIYPVTIRRTGLFQPDLANNPTWRPGDFLLSVDGITLEQAHQMRYIRQEKNG